MPPARKPLQYGDEKYVAKIILRFWNNTINKNTLNFYSLNSEMYLNSEMNLNSAKIYLNLRTSASEFQNLIIYVFS